MQWVSRATFTYIKRSPWEERDPSTVTYEKVKQLFRCMIWTQIGFVTQIISGFGPHKEMILYASVNGNFDIIWDVFYCIEACSLLLKSKKNHTYNLKLKLLQSLINMNILFAHIIKAFGFCFLSSKLFTQLPFFMKGHILILHNFYLCATV